MVYEAAKGLSQFVLNVFGEVPLRSVRSEREPQQEKLRESAILIDTFQETVPY